MTLKHLFHKCSRDGERPVHLQRSPFFNNDLVDWPSKLSNTCTEASDWSTQLPDLHTPANVFLVGDKACVSNKKLMNNTKSR